MSETVCLGERYIGCGASEGEIRLRGTPGNALGAYLDGGGITVYGNAQDATGDTMNGGTIVIHGNTGDAAGYAMRGGQIYVRGDAGYRTGVHMKAYRDKLPVIVVGGSCGSFCGEYLAGGMIIVLGLGGSGVPVGNFCGVGMYGGSIILRSDELPCDLSDRVTGRTATQDDMAAALPYIRKFCELFGTETDAVLDRHFYLLTPDTKNPYKRLYVYN